MRADWSHVEKYRQQVPWVSQKGDDYGAFLIPHCGAGRIDNLFVIASNGDPAVPWEHVSVSVSGANRCPTWGEMDAVKRLFWADDETVMQLHVPRAEHRNLHEYTLHLWRPKDAEIPRPPSWMVA